MTNAQIKEIEKITTYQFLSKIHKANGDIVWEFVKYRKTLRRRDPAKTYEITLSGADYIIERFEEDEKNGYVRIKKNVPINYKQSIMEALGV